MNLSRLDHDYIKSQEEQSWIDDPFDLKGTALGIKGVDHERNLDSYTYELVSNYASFSENHYSLSLDMLPQDEQNKLSALYIETIDREIEYACYGLDESINSNYLCAMLAMLQDDCEDSRENFAEVTRKNIIIYYTKSLNNILSSACDIFNQMEANEAEHRFDNDGEEIVWGDAS